MSPQPSLAAFRDAQSTLRQQLGTDATFYVPQPGSYDPAEPIDPETQRPFDPFADPTSGTGVPREEVVRVTVADPGKSTDDKVVSAAGPVFSNDIVLDVDIADETRIDGAAVVEVFGERYRVQEARRDGLTEAIRLLVYCEKA